MGVTYTLPTTRDRILQSTISVCYMTTLIDILTIAVVWWVQAIVWLAHGVTFSRSLSTATTRTVGIALYKTTKIHHSTRTKTNNSLSLHTFACLLNLIFSISDEHHPAPAPLCRFSDSGALYKMSWLEREIPHCPVGKLIHGFSGKPG